MRLQRCHIELACLSKSSLKSRFFSLIILIYLWGDGSLRERRRGERRSEDSLQVFVHSTSGGQAWLQSLLPVLRYLMSPQKV